MIAKIPFRAFTGKASLEIEIPGDTGERFRLRAAVEIPEQMIDAAAEWLAGDDSAYEAEPDFARRAAKYMLEAALTPLPIETAKRDGSHILGIIRDGRFGFGWFNGRQVPMQTVIHWHEDGFYVSVNDLEPQRPFPATHWIPLFIAS